MTQRIQAIAQAATVLFLQQGYSKTQISHIAKAVGVSVGTIYLYFSGKKEILHFILKGTLEPEFLNQSFDRPITDELFPGLENDIVAMFEQTGRDFAKHLENNAADYSLKALVSDAFDLLSQYAVGCLFLEKNQVDFPFLAEQYRQYRKKFLETTTQYMALFVQRGTVRPLKHLELSTTLIIEMLSWWAMDIRYTSFETQEIPPALAKELCMDNILSAYQRKD